MKIKINGVEVRNELLGEEVEMKFENLTPEVQEKVFLDNKEAYLVDALISKHQTVNSLAIQNMKELSNPVLNQAVKVLIEGPFDYKKVDILLAILSIENLKLSYDLREKLAFCPYWSIKKWVAQNKETPGYILRQMFIKEKNDMELLNLIIKNTRFKLDKELIKI